MTSYVAITWAAAEVRPGVIPAVRCAHPECGVVFTDTQVVRHVSQNAADTYLEIRQRARDAQVYGKAEENARRMIAEATTTTTTAVRPTTPGGIAISPAEKEILVQQWRGMFPNALMCPKCKYGPVDFRDCDDLRKHHGENGVSNACPKCRFFSARRGDWSRWDGVYRADDATPSSGGGLLSRVLGIFARTPAKP